MALHRYVEVLIALGCVTLSDAFLCPLLKIGKSPSLSSRVWSLPNKACDPRPPSRMGATKIVQLKSLADGGGGKEKWGDPPVEVVEDAVDRAVTLVKASGGSMDSLSFGAAWRVAYPTYDKDVFKNTSVTSFTKLLQKFAQDELIVESTAKKEVKLYKLRDSKVREQLEQSIKMTMQTMEFFSEIAGSSGSGPGGPWALNKGLMSIGPPPSLRRDNTLSLPPDMINYSKLSKLVDDLEPTVLAIENKISNLPAKEAVTALHHLRRLAWQAQYQVQQNRLESIMRVFADVSTQKINNLNTKSIALLLSALSDRDNFQPVFDAASERLKQLADEALEASGPEGAAVSDAVHSVFSTQAVAVIVNSFAKSKRRDDKLFRTMSGVVLALPPEDFDAQAVAGIANGFAFADVRPHDKALFARLAAITHELPQETWTPYAVGLAVSAYHKVGGLQGDLLIKLAGLTEAMVKAQGVRAFQDPSLLADMIVAFAEAGESSGVPQKQVISLLASSFLSLMTSPVKSSGGSTTLKRKVVVRKASEVSEDSQDEESEDSDGIEGSFMRPPAKPKAFVKSPEQEEKEAQAASLRFRKKLDVVIIGKVTRALCAAEVYTSPLLWTSFSRTLQGFKIQPWQGSDWGIVLESFTDAAQAKALPPNNLASLFLHVVRDLETGDAVQNFSPACLASMASALPRDKATISNAPLFILLAQAASNIPAFRYTTETADSTCQALRGWYSEGGLDSNKDASDALERAMVKISERVTSN